MSLTFMLVTIGLIIFRAENIGMSFICRMRLRDISVLSSSRMAMGNGWTAAEEEKLRKDIEESEKKLAGYRQEISEFKQTTEERKRDFENERKKLVSQAAFHKSLASAISSVNYLNTVIRENAHMKSKIASYV